MADERARITELLGRAPMGEFEVVVRRSDGDPAVLRNEPLLPDGTPMPTLYWLCDPALRSAIGTIESDGGVREAEAALGPELIAAAHAAYAVERDREIPADHKGPAPYGGVGGTREGLKCLHAHFAYWLAGGDDPVGQWTNDRLVERDLLPADAPKRVIR
ncbi:MAG: DUF501 domain-containing protein [Acidimicrobiia bacterium]|nr:DUF501 domain-containing protein [Acidimicrobiia bacterium]